MLTRFFIEGIKRAGSEDKEAITEAMVDQSLMSGNGEVYLRPEDRHVDLNVLIAETTDGQLVLKEDIGRVEAPNQCRGLSGRPAADGGAARGRGPRQGVRRRPGAGRRQPVDRRGRAALHHRPERLRQDHPVQRDHRRLPADAGTVRFAGRGHHRTRPHRISRLGIGRKFQVPGIYPSLTVAENLEVPLVAGAGRRGLLGCSCGAARRSHASGTARAFALPSTRQPAGGLAHGQKQWLEIAMLLAGEARLLLLDEPTAGMTSPRPRRPPT